ncbi:hypothetical protein R4Z09_11395 [Niallia oryzisoli]|uniref:Uncharacterized protein n=1 Tax=Niallia oryzisoli TaxID=1737571 RepID=A0ABZ2CIE9_9BACI
MENLQIKKNMKVGSENEFKVVKVNLTNPTESIYAVCTPIKLK